MLTFSATYNLSIVEKQIIIKLHQLSSCMDGYWTMDSLYVFCCFHELLSLHSLVIFFFCVQSGRDLSAFQNEDYNETLIKTICY